MRFFRWSVDLIEIAQPMIFEVRAEHLVQFGKEVFDLGGFFLFLHRN